MRQVIYHWELLAAITWEKASHPTGVQTDPFCWRPTTGVHLAGDVPQEDDGLFRERLHGLLLKERDRLLGSWSTLSPEDNW